MRKPALFQRRPNLARIGLRHAPTAAGITALAVVAGVLEGAGIGLLIPFLSTFSNTAPTARGGRLLGWLGNIAGAHSRDGRLFVVAGFILACILLRCCVSATQAVLTAWVHGRVGHEIRCALSGKLGSAPYAFFLSQKESRLVNILTEESWRVSEAVRVVLTQVASTAVVIAFGVLLFLVSWELSVVVFLGALLPRTLQRTVKARLREKGKHVVVSNEALVTRTLFSIFGARLIRLFHSQSWEHARFSQRSDDLRRALFSTERVSSLLGPALEVSHGLLFLLVLFVAVFNGLSVPVLVAFLVLMNRRQPHLRNLEDSKALLAATAVHFDEVEWLLAQPAPPSATGGQLPYSGLRATIAFQDVSFTYPGVEEPALRSANFTLHRGRAVALIGPSGAGKSTVINLLCGLLQPTSGAILIDGQPLSTLNVEDWLGTIAVAGQDLELMDGTVAENVAYGRPGLSRTAIHAALTEARAGFVHDLPQGIETVVGSRGLSLSGGQRQRLGLARALARKPELLILDEATNAVDIDTEESILQTVKDLPSGTTVLVVSHRPSTLAFCDEAIAVHENRTVRNSPTADPHAETPFELAGYAQS